MLATISNFLFYFFNVRYQPSLVDLSLVTRIVRLSNARLYNYRSSKTDYKNQRVCYTALILPDNESSNHPIEKTWIELPHSYSLAPSKLFMYGERSEP